APSAALVWALRERDKKAEALTEETRARGAERQALNRAMTALRDMTDDIVEDQMARDAQLTEENRQYLRKVLAHFEGLAAVTADDAEGRAIRAEGHFRVGLMRVRLGELKEAEAAYGEALALFQQLAADFPGPPGFRHDLARAHNNRGILLRTTGRLQDAEAAYADALALQRQLAAEFPARPEFRQELARTHNNRGVLLVALARP